MSVWFDVSCLQVELRKHSTEKKIFDNNHM
jgi:hypothetical protein